MAKKQDKGGKDAGKGGKSGGKAAAAGPSKGAKAKKKSWTKIKVKEKLNNAVFLDQKGYDNIAKSAPKLQALTVSIVCDKFKVNGAVARKLMRDLQSKGLIKQVGEHHSKFNLYTGSQYGVKAPDAPAEKAPAAKKGAAAKE